MKEEDFFLAAKVTYFQERNFGRVLSTEVEEYHSKTVRNVGAVGED